MKFSLINESYFEPVKVEFLNYRRLFMFLFVKFDSARHVYSRTFGLSETHNRISVSIPSI